MGCMGSKNKPTATAAPIKKEDPKTANAAKWWLKPVGDDKNVTLTLDGKVATGKSGS